MQRIIFIGFNIIFVFLFTSNAFATNRADPPHVEAEIYEPNDTLILAAAVRPDINPGGIITTLRKLNQCVSRTEKNWYCVRLEARCNSWSDPDYDKTRVDHNSAYSYLDATKRESNGVVRIGNGFKWKDPESSGDAGEIIEIMHDGEDSSNAVLTLNDLSSHNTEKKWRTCWYKPPELDEADLSSEVQSNEVTIKLQIDDEGDENDDHDEDDEIIDVDETTITVHKDFLSMYYDLFNGKESSPTPLGNTNIEEEIHINCHRSTILLATGNLQSLDGSDEGLRKTVLQVLLQEDYTAEPTDDYYDMWDDYYYLCTQDSFGISLLPNDLERGDVIAYYSIEDLGEDVAVQEGTWLPTGSFIPFIAHTQTVLNNSGSEIKAFGANNEAMTLMIGTLGSYRWDESWMWANEKIYNYYKSQIKDYHLYLSLNPNLFNNPSDISADATPTIRWIDIWRKQ